jgi:hypothetical protein
MNWAVGDDTGLISNRLQFVSDHRHAQLWAFHTHRLMVLSTFAEMALKYLPLTSNTKPSCDVEIPSHILSPLFAAFLA